MRGGGKPQNKHLRATIAETRDRFAPVFPLAKCTAPFAGDLRQVKHKPRALSATNDFVIQLFECFQHCSRKSYHEPENRRASSSFPSEVRSLPLPLQPSLILTFALG